MRNQNELLAMTAHARAEEAKAADQGRMSGEDVTAAREFAAGVEAGLLWALGNIGEIPWIPAVEHVKPTPYNDKAEGESIDWFAANARPIKD